MLCPHQLFNSLDFSLKNSNKTFGGHPWTDIRLEKPGLKLALTSGKVRLFGTQSSHQATIPDLDDEEANADADQDSDFGEHLNTQLGISMRIIWRHYYRQLQGCRPTVHRILPIDKLMYFIQEINDLRFRLEGIVLENDRIPLGENHEGEHDFNRALLHNFVIVENEHGDLVLQTPKHLVEEAEAAEKAAAAKRVADGSGTAATSIIKAPQVETCMLAAYVDVVDLQFMRDHKGFEFSSKFSDFVYKFFEYRYQFKDIAVNVAHDFLSCLQVYEGEDKVGGKGGNHAAYEFRCMTTLPPGRANVR